MSSGRPLRMQDATLRPALARPEPESPELSVVIPVFDEEDNVERLHDELTTTLRELGRSYEIVVVDDGSRDETFPRLARLAASDPHLKLVELRRNYGQTAALSAGFDHATGRIIVPMDGDLQNDPRDIGALLAKLEEGYDVVSGWRQDRKEGLLRRLPSRMANWLIGRVTGVRLHDYGCTLKAYRADVVNEVRLYGEMHRFLPAIAYQSGARIGEVPVRHHARAAGRSKYGLGRTFKVLIDLLTVKFLSVVVDEAEPRFRRKRALPLLHRLALRPLDRVRATRQPHLRLPAALARRRRVPVHDRLQPDPARPPRRADRPHLSRVASETCLPRARAPQFRGAGAALLAALTPQCAGSAGWSGASRSTGRCSSG